MEGFRVLRQRLRGKILVDDGVKGAAVQMQRLHSLHDWQVDRLKEIEEVTFIQMPIWYANHEVPIFYLLLE